MTHHQTRTINRLFFMAAVIVIAVNLRPSMAGIGPVLDRIQTDLQLSFTEASLLTMLPVLFMGAAMFLSYRLLHIASEKTCISAGLLIIALGSGLRWVVGDDVSLILTAIIIGLGIAVIQAMLPAVLKRVYPTAVALFMGIYVTSIMGGAALASSLTPFVAEVTDSWRVSLGVWAFVALLALGLWWLIPSQHLGSGRPSNRSGDLLRFRRTWMVGLFFGIGTASYTCVLAWLPPYYVDLGWSGQKAGFMLTFMTSVEVVVGLLIPALAAKHPDRRPVLFGLIAVLLVGYAGLSWCPETAVYVWPLLLGVGIGGLFPMSLIVSMDHFDDPERAGQLTSYVQGIGYVIAALSPLLAGYVKDWMGGFQMAWVGLLVLTLCLIPLAGLFAPRGYAQVFIRSGGQARSGAQG